MNLFIYVEGQEEELFVNRVLRGHLRSFGVIVQKPISVDSMQPFRRSSKPSRSRTASVL